MPNGGSPSARLASRPPVARAPISNIDQLLEDPFQPALWFAPRIKRKFCSLSGRAYSAKKSRQATCLHHQSFNLLAHCDFGLLKPVRRRIMAHNLHPNGEARLEKNHMKTSAQNTRYRGFTLIELL